MPYGTPSAGGYSYALTFRSDAGVDGNPLLVYCTFSTENQNHPDMADRFQTLVDLITDSPDFYVTSAVREQTYNEAATATT